MVISIGQLLVGYGGGDIHLPVKLQGNPRHELTRKRFVRSFAAFFAKGEVIIDRIMKCLSQFADALTLERNHVAGIDHFTVENGRFIVEFKLPDVSFVFHHGMTPVSVRKRRIGLTIPSVLSAAANVERTSLRFIPNEKGEPSRHPKADTSPRSGRQISTGFVQQDLDVTNQMGAMDDS